MAAPVAAVAARTAAPAARAGAAGRTGTAAKAGRGAKAPAGAIPLEDLPPGPLRDRALAAAGDIDEPAKKTLAKKAPGRKAPAKKRGARARARGRRSWRRGVQAVTPAARSQLLGAGDVLAGTVVVAVIYLVITSSQQVAGVMGGLGRALDWLSSPDRSIPYKR